MVDFDQRKPQDVARLFAETRSQLGVPTILVNDAGIDSTGVPVKDMKIEDWDNIIRTNLYGPFYCCQQFLRAIDGSGKHGSIINISSIHEDVPSPGAAGYDCAKGALHNLTTTLALEVANKNINVNAIAPGMVLTPMNEAAVKDPVVRQQQTQSIPLKRAARPDEIAAVAVFLASHDARYMLGSTVVVDGGLSHLQEQHA